MSMASVKLCMPFMHSNLTLQQYVRLSFCTRCVLDCGGGILMNMCSMVRVEFCIIMPVQSTAFKNDDERVDGCCGYSIAHLTA